MTERDRLLLEGMRIFGIKALSIVEESKTIEEARELIMNYERRIAIKLQEEVEEYFCF